MVLNKNIMSDNRRIAKNTMFLYIRMFLSMTVSLYTSRVILQILGIEDYGIYNVVGGIVTMFTFLNGSLGSATSRYITFELGRKDYNRLKKIFSTALLVHISVAFIVVLLAETIGLWFFYEKMVVPDERFDAAFWVYQISILTTVVSITQVPYNADIIAHENMKIYAYVGLIEVFARLGIVYLLLISPIDKLIFYAILLFSLSTIIALFYRAYCLKNYSESHFSVNKDKALYKDMFKYTGSDMIGAVSVMLQGQGINLLLNMFFGPVVNAARAIAYQVQGAVTQFSANFMTAVRPQIIKSYARGEFDSMWRLVIRSSCFSYYLMWLLCLPIMLEADTILSLWLGKYPEHTVYFLKLILILCLIQTVKNPRVTIFHATGKVFWSNITVGIVLCLAFPLAYIFLKMGGEPEDAFWAVNITMVVSEFVSVAVLKKFIDFSALKYFLQVHGRCLLVTLASFILPFFLYNRFMEPSFLRLIYTVILTTLSVLLSSLYLGMDKDIRIKLFDIVRTKVFKKK